MKRIDDFLFYDESFVRKEKPLFVVVGDRTGKTPNLLASEGKKVVVYEADKKNYESMLQNLEVEEGIEVIARLNAVTGFDKPYVLNVYETPSSNSMFQRSDRKFIGTYAGEGVSVETITKEFGTIDVMLVNCEGGEWQILKEIVHKKLPVNQICVSFHQFAKPKDWHRWKPLIANNYKLVEGNKKYNYWLLIKK